MKRICKQIWPRRPLRQLLLLAAMMIGAFACGEPLVKSAPPELIDTWVSTHPRYQGLYLKIGPDKFEYSTAAGTVETFTITQYRSDKNAKKLQPQRHTLTGERSGQISTLNLVLDPRHGGVLTFTNRSNIMWVREKSLPK